MDISYSKEAQRAFNSSPKVIQHYANSLLASYAQYANRHSLPGKSTLSNISKTARSLLNLPPGTVIFVRKEKSVPRGTNPAPRIGTAHPKRKSEATKKTPTKRLVARRKRNTDEGYFPNPLESQVHRTRTKKNVNHPINFPYAVQYKNTGSGEWHSLSAFKELEKAKEYAAAYANAHPYMYVRVEHATEI